MQNNLVEFDGEFEIGKEVPISYTIEEIEEESKTGASSFMTGSVQLETEKYKNKRKRFNLHRVCLLFITAFSFTLASILCMTLK